MHFLPEQLQCLFLHFHAGSQKLMFVGVLYIRKLPLVAKLVFLVKKYNKYYNPREDKERNSTCSHHDQDLVVLILRIWHTYAYKKIRYITLTNTCNTISSSVASSL